MAEIGTYVCSNNQCKLTLRLGRDFPVWKSGTPRSLQTPTPSTNAVGFIERYRTDVLCTSCRKTTDAQSGEACPNCGEASLRFEQLGQPCPQCNAGIFSLSHVSVY